MSKRFGDAVFSAIVALLVPLPLVLLAGLRDDVSAYSKADLWAAAAIFLVVLAWDSFGRRHELKDREGVVEALFPYIGTVVFFAIVTLAVSPDSESERPSTGIFLSLALLALLCLVREGGAQQRMSEQIADAAVGFATTGILVTTEPRESAFVLVLNKNLNSGNGLWVPPGGHFEPADGVDPADELLKKIEDEVGVQAAIQEVEGERAIADEFSTNETTWLTPPLFLLDEDLLGTCSKGHQRHIDFVYLCRMVRAVRTRHRSKYGQSDQLQIAVGSCLPSTEAAEAALVSAVEEWETSVTGRASGIKNTVSRDVAQRLHLAATALDNNLVGEADV
jgi:8-oxo-dGTP pyrophosphatase MutT (NUDIX family)